MKSDTASSEARTGLAVVAVWWLAESAAVMRTEVPGSRTLVSLFLLSCLPGASVALSLWALRRGGHAARLVGSGLAAAAAIFLTASLFAGPWIRAQTWAVLGRWLVVAGIALSAWFVGRRWQQRQHETRAGRLVALAMGLAALWLDDRLYPHHYPDLHRGTALAFLVAITFALRGLRGIPAAGSSLTVLTILAVATLAVGLIPGTDIDTRRQLLRTTRWTGPILASCLPTPAPPGDAREELLLAMSAAQPIDGSRLDAHWPQRRSLDLVLITIDALRPDRLGAYGSTRGLTPNLDRFLDETVVFRHAYASFPSSRRSMGGMLTGYYPSANELAAPSAADKPPLAERLADLGYRSEAFTHLPPWFLDQAMAHLRRGFDAFSNVDPGGGDTGPAVVAQALRALEAPRSRPRFVWVHLFDPHGPYRSRGAGEDSEEARYDGEVAHVDRILAHLLQLLADPRRRDDTAVVFCADHGEAFGEHRQVGHGKTVYEEEVRVPLAFRFPGVA
ncbi:MAG: sulfatase-like hydrolase/transferase, partial [Salinibacterium sp.]|nr:sulfatase-like hydrolase/transferase [Salinibacterium sp.]